MRKQDKSFVIVWVALLVLLAATTGSAFIPLGAWNGVLNLVIAAAKAALVLLFFMRLRAGHVLVRLAAVTGIATLAILFALSGSDYATRRSAPAPWQAPAQIAPAFR